MLLAPLLLLAFSLGSPEEEPSLADMLASEDFTGLDKRFATLLKSPNLHTYFAMNNAESICQHNGPCRNKGQVNPHITYDSEENAALVTTEFAGISSRYQLRHYWEQLDYNNAEKVSVQWEFKYDSGYLSTGGLQNYKAFQLTGSNEGLQWEEQCVFFRTKADVVCLPTTRYYRKWAGISEMSDNEPISTRGPFASRVIDGLMDDWQPGGETAADKREAPFGLEDHLKYTGSSPFLIKANEWHRLTLEFTFDSEANEMRVKKWIKGETTPTTLVLDSVKEPGKGFLLSNDLSIISLSIQNWWLEMNSSQEGRIPNEAKVWVKNLVVYKNASIPLE